MLVIPDQLDPLTIHFYFAGNVPPGSFQFMGVWDFGDGNVSSDSCPVHQYMQPGVYTVCLTFNICIGGGMSCHDDTCRIVNVGTIAGIESAEQTLHNFYCYPNPFLQNTSGQLYVRSDCKGIMELSISDIEGNVVLSRPVENDKAFDVSTLNAGLYFIELRDNNSLLKKKLLIQ